MKKLIMFLVLAITLISCATAGTVITSPSSDGLLTGTENFIGTTNENGSVTCTLYKQDIKRYFEYEELAKQENVINNFNISIDFCQKNIYANDNYLKVSCVGVSGESYDELHNMWIRCSNDEADISKSIINSITKLFITIFVLIPVILLILLIVYITNKVSGKGRKR